MVRRQARVTPGHQVAQGKAPQHEAVIVMESFLTSPSVYVRALASTALALWLFALRYCHAQRSRIVTVTPWYLVGQATRGKKRTGGVRTPFTWAGPRFCLCGSDVLPAFKKVEEIMFAEFGGAPQFLLPDFYPKNAAREEVIGFRNAPMSGGRFNYFVRQLLASPPHELCERITGTISYHDWRHGLPTLAGRSMLPASEAIRVGLWTGAKDGDTDTSLARRMAMPLLYSTERNTDSAVSKTQLVRALRRAIIVYLNHRGIHASRLEAVWILKKFALDRTLIPDLDALVPFWPQRTNIVSETQDYIRAKLTALEASSGNLECIDDGDLLQADRPATEDEEPLTGRSSDSSTASRSSGGSSVQGVEDIQYVHVDRLGSRLHLADTSTTDSLDHGATRCGRRLARCVRGFGVREAMATHREWSPRCRGLLDDHIALLWN